MKKQRQEAIRTLLSSQRVETQEELVDALRARGFQVTQATISRDMKEMHLTKMSIKEGGYAYAVTEYPKSEITERRTRILRDALVQIDHAGHIIVVKTLSGSANSVAEALDSMEWEEVLGSIAGDNTIFLVTRDEHSAGIVSDRIWRIVHPES